MKNKFIFLLSLTIFCFMSACGPSKTKKPKTSKITYEKVKLAQSDENIILNNKSFYAAFSKSGSGQKPIRLNKSDTESVYAAVNQVTIVSKSDKDTLKSLLTIIFRPGHKFAIFMKWTNTGYVGSVEKKGNGYLIKGVQYKYGKQNGGGMNFQIKGQ